jgi:hypothetical protein
MTKKVETYAKKVENIHRDKSYIILYGNIYLFLLVEK